MELILLFLVLGLIGVIFFRIIFSLVRLIVIGAIIFFVIIFMNSSHIKCNTTVEDFNCHLTDTIQSTHQSHITDNDD